MAAGRLRGGGDLRKRLAALKLAFKPIGRQWGNRTVVRYRASVPSRTGKTRGSFRVRNATQKRAVVGGSFVAYFIDKGPVAHDIKGKKGPLVFQASGRTIFARQVHHRGYRGRPFRDRQARAALRETPMADALVKAWNDAA